MSPAKNKLHTSYAELEKILKEATSPRSETELALAVAHKHGADPNGAVEARNAVHMTELHSFLDLLAENGVAARLRGADLTSFYGIRTTSSYWVHAEHLSRWSLAAQGKSPQPGKRTASAFVHTRKSTEQDAPEAAAHRRVADLPTEEDTWFNVLRGLEKLPYAHTVGISHEEAEENRATPDSEDRDWFISVGAPFAATIMLQHSDVMAALALMAVGYDRHRGHIEPPVYMPSITEELMDAVIGEGTWRLSMEAGAAIVLQCLYGSVVGPDLLRRILPDVS